MRCARQHVRLAGIRVIPLMLTCLFKDWVRRATNCGALELGYLQAYPLLRRGRLPMILPINCDCSFCAQPSPQTGTAPSSTTSLSSQGARCITGISESPNELHMTHQRSLAPFNTPQFGPAHRLYTLGVNEIGSTIATKIVADESPCVTRRLGRRIARSKTVESSGADTTLMANG